MKYLYIVFGSIALALGILGIFLPLLPTTPFLLLAAALYFRGSERLYTWLLRHKHLGPYIKNFRENKAIPMRIKVWTISLLWVTILTSIFFVTDHLAIQLLLVTIAIAVTIHICSYRTLYK